jgi:peptidoglycan/xylan/chitin deacetylase (PgdA/CDA1 family)
MSSDDGKTDAVRAVRGQALDRLVSGGPAVRRLRAAAAVLIALIVASCGAATGGTVSRAAGHGVIAPANGSAPLTIVPPRIPPAAGDRPAVPPPLIPPGDQTVGPSRTYHVPVLMYHRIAFEAERGRSLPGLVVDPRRFDSQLGALRNAGWRTITSAQLAAAVFAGASIPARTFTITIDDGHEDGYTHAFPILRRLGFVATFFVIAGRIGRHGYLTWPQLATMQAAGMEIGNHSLNHVDEWAFTRDQTDHQVLAAQQLIDTHLGQPPVSFAYPFGASPPNLVASVTASGLRVAYTELAGARESAAAPYFWPRLRVDPTTGRGLLWLVRAFA